MKVWALIEGRSHSLFIPYEVDSSPCSALYFEPFTSSSCFELLYNYLSYTLSLFRLCCNYIVIILEFYIVFYIFIKLNINNYNNINLIIVKLLANRVRVT